MRPISTISEDDYSYFDPRVCVIGLGHTGLVHALAFSESYRTIGYDSDQTRVEELRRGHDSLSGISGELVQQALRKGFTCTSDLEDIRKCNFFVITLPPEAILSDDPDRHPLRSACEVVGRVISGGDIVVFDSCGCPSMSEKECIPMVEKLSGFICNCDFFAGYSPGPLQFPQKGFTFWNDGKITSGSTPEIAKIVDEVYINAFGADSLVTPLQETILGRVI